MYVRGAKWLLAALMCAAVGCDDDESSTGADAAPTADAGDADATPPPPPPPSKTYGEFCTADAQCMSSVCHLQACSQLCDPEAANDCRDVDAFCVPTAFEKNVCYGRVETGDETDDDAVLALGDVLTRKLTVDGDADLFQIVLPAGTYRVSASPQDPIDVQLDIYDFETKNVARAADGTVGEGETIEMTVARPGRHYLVVRNLSKVSSNYTIGVTAL